MFLNKGKKGNEKQGNDILTWIFFSLHYASAITVDNVTLGIDGVLYLRILDPYLGNFYTICNDTNVIELTNDWFFEPKSIACYDLLICYNLYSIDRLFKFRAISPTVRA